MKSKRSNQKIQLIAVTAVLAALIAVMSFTPIGYLRIGAVSITFIPIPVVIGAIVGGPLVGTLLGAVFGITSIIQCFMGDPFGSTLMGINPYFTFIMCLVPRMLMGLCSGLIYKAIANKTKSTTLPYIVTSFSGGFLNTALFVASLILLFGRYEQLYQMGMGESILSILGALITLNAAIEWAACLIIGTAVTKALGSAFKQLKK